MCPLLSVRFYSFYFFIRFSMNIFFTKHPSGWSLCFWLSYPRCLAPDTVGWWAQVDSNHRPRAYQARALTTWAMSPLSYFRCISSLSPFVFLPYFTSFADQVLAPAACRWWRWWDSNPWPPACRAGALPTELHPLIFKGFFTVTENWTTNFKALSSHRAPLHS